MAANRGMASLEAVTISVVLVMVLTYIWGTFGVIHTGIVNSIAARSYAFETFRNRSNLVYFRDGASPLGIKKAVQYKDFGFRMHGIASEKAEPGNPQWYAPERKLAYNGSTPIRGASMTVHNVNLAPDIQDSKTENQLVGRESNFVNPVWIKIAYGICLVSTCGGNP